MTLLSGLILNQPPQQLPQLASRAMLPASCLGSLGDIKWRPPEVSVAVVAESSAHVTGGFTRCIFSSCSGQVILFPPWLLRTSPATLKDTLNDFCFVVMAIPHAWR